MNNLLKIISNIHFIFQKFPDLKFKYVEEEKPEEFFGPYVWSLVNILSGINFESTLYKLN